MAVSGGASVEVTNEDGKGYRLTRDGEGVRIERVGIYWKEPKVPLSEVIEAVSRLNA
jgi:hypothetical protein